MTVTPYPTINDTVVSTLNSSVNYAVNVVPLFGVGWILAVFGIAFLATSQFEFKTRLLYSTTLTSMASIILVALGILDQRVMQLFLLVAGILLVMSFLLREN